MVIRLNRTDYHKVKSQNFGVNTRQSMEKCTFVLAQQFETALLPLSYSAVYTCIIYERIQ